MTTISCNIWLILYKIFKHVKDFWSTLYYTFLCCCFVDIKTFVTFRLQEKSNLICKNFLHWSIPCGRLVSLLEIGFLISYSVPHTSSGHSSALPSSCLFISFKKKEGGGGYERFFLLASQRNHKRDWKWESSRGSFFFVFFLPLFFILFFLFFPQIFFLFV